MKILFAPTMILPALTANQRSRIDDAAGAGLTLVEAKDPARQREEIADAEILLGRVSPDVFNANRDYATTTPSAPASTRSSRRSS